MKCCNRERKKKWKYIFYSEEVKEKGGITSGWEGRVKEIKKMIQQLEKKNEL